MNACTDNTLTPEATFAAASDSATCTWWSTTSFLSIEGEDAVTFLDGVTTQDVAAVDVGTTRFALFLTNKARIIASALLYRAAEGRILLELDPQLIDELAGHLKKYKLRAKASIERVELRAVSVVGPASTDYSGDGWFDSPAWGAPTRTWVGSTEDAQKLLAETLVPADVLCADPDALDAVRIRHAAPSLADLAPGFMPAEVSAMEAAVSLTKGCYLGQEPVARLHYRGHPNRTLRQVRLTGDVPDDWFDRHSPGDDDYLGLTYANESEGKRAPGSLTSWAHDHELGVVGFAVLRRDVEDGTELQLIDSSVGVMPTSL